MKGCERTFDNGKSAKAHEKTCKFIVNSMLSARVYCQESNCPASVTGFTRNADLNRHMRNCHNKKNTTKDKGPMIKQSNGRWVTKKP